LTSSAVLIDNGVRDRPQQDLPAIPGQVVPIAFGKQSIQAILNDVFRQIRVSGQRTRET
jgi:hypothetical protein